MIMLTLTYRPSVAWAPNQIGPFCTKWAKEVGRSYVWVAELTKRGRMHYHVLTSLPEGALWSKERIEFDWYFGYVWITDNIRRPFYLSKYLQKERSKYERNYPKGARIVGMSRPTRYISDTANRERLTSRIPDYVRGAMEQREIREGAYFVHRVSGGFSVNGQPIAAPYSNKDLLDICTVTRQMRDNLNPF